ncbi:hypothetical protein ACFL6Y_08185 [Elusimicrobiota bacterium]
MKTKLDELKKFIKDYIAHPDEDNVLDLDSLVRKLLPDSDLTDFIAKEIVNLPDDHDSFFLELLAKAGRREVLGFLGPIENNKDADIRLRAASAYIYLGEDKGYDMLANFMEKSAKSDRHNDAIPLEWIIDTLDEVDDPRAVKLKERTLSAIQNRSKKKSP